MSHCLVWWEFCQAPDRDGHAEDGPGTRWGWTFPTWTDAIIYGHGSDVSGAAFQAMTQAQAGALAASYFWERLGGDKLNDGANISYIDWRWTSGGATLQVQKHLGIHADGVFGPQTLAAINAVEPLLFCQSCRDWRVAYYDSIGLRQSDPGLYIRADQTLLIARDLIAGRPPNISV